MAELHDLTALEQGDLVRRREVSPVELTEHYLERAAATGLDDVGAFVTLTPELALDRARSLTAGEDDGPLHGVPTAIKDLNLTAGVPTQFGSPVFADYVPDVSDAVTLAIEAAGHGQPRQDVDPGVRLALLHRAGGLPAGGDAVGPDPDGRRLLRWRGRRGGRRAGAGGPGLGRRRLDPDPGVLLRAVRAQAHARADQRLPDVRGPGRAWRRPGRSPGPCATRRRCSTCSPVVGLAILPGRHLRPGRSSSACDRPPGTLRIARFTDPVIADVAVDEACLEAVVDASRLLESLGHHVEDVAVPMPPEAVPVFETCWAVLTALSVVPPDREHLMRPLTRWLTERGRAVDGPQFGLAIGAMRRFAATTLEALAPYDIVLTPTLAARRCRSARSATTPTRPRTSRRRRPSRRGPRPGTSPGMPAASLPLHWTESAEGTTLPVGVMLAARPAEEELLLSLCAQVEEAAPWADRKPPGW